MYFRATGADTGPNRYIPEHYIKTNMVATKMVLEKYSDDHDDNEKREKIEKRKKGEIHRVISEKVTGTQWDKVTIETPD